MSLRAKVLALYLLLAAAPLLVLGAYEYTRSLDAVEALIASQNARSAQRVADAIETRAALLESDLLFLSENAETQRWLAAAAAGDRPSDEAARAARPFLEALWARLGAGYAGVELTDDRGAVLFAAGRNGGISPSGGLDPIVRPVRSLADSHAIGTIRLQPIVEGLVPTDLLSVGFGEQGFGMVIDRAAGRVVYLPGAAGRSLAAAEVLGPEVQPEALGAPRGTFRYHRRDTLLIASYASLSTLPWTVVMSGAVGEFAAPFATVGRSTLFLFAAVALLATLVFGFLLRRTTRSLEALTAATAVVGRGDFAPRLPPAGRDEVGRLTSAFAGMAARLGAMVDELRTSRQMAVLGEFAAQLSHEVRNPLTSIKLNLQKIDRAVRGRDDAAALARPLEIALREVGRLDGVVSGVLTLARQDGEPSAPASLHGLVREALEVVADQAAGQGVRIESRLEAASDRVHVSAGRIRGAVLNLLLNALEAMPSGGTLRLETLLGDGRITLRVTDTGPGIPEADHAAIFRPFATTKPGGTGLGLPLARRAIEEDGGTLTAEPREGGAQLAVRLPLAST